MLTGRCLPRSRPSLVTAATNHTIEQSISPLAASEVTATGAPASTRKEMLARRRQAFVGRNLTQRAQRGWTCEMDGRTAGPARPPAPDPGSEALRGPLQLRHGYKAAPDHSTRKALLHARKLAQVPHISYDLDGDQVVGPRDYFIAKMFDSDGKHGLDEQQQAAAASAIKQHGMHDDSMELYYSHQSAPLDERPEKVNSQNHTRVQNVLKKTFQIRPTQVSGPPQIRRQWILLEPLPPLALHFSATLSRRSQSLKLSCAGSCGTRSIVWSATTPRATQPSRTSGSGRQSPTRRWPRPGRHSSLGRTPTHGPPAAGPASLRLPRRSDITHTGQTTAPAQGRPLECCGPTRTRPYEWCRQMPWLMLAVCTSFKYTTSLCLTDVHVCR